MCSGGSSDSQLTISVDAENEIAVVDPTRDSLYCYDEAEQK